MDDVLLAGTPAPANQTITVTTPAPASAAYGNSFTVAATASSGLGVAISASGSCSGNGTGSATITMSSSSGTCTINYNQAGNSSYNAAPLVTESTSATKKDVSVSATGINKVFDGNTDATVTPTVNGALIGDDVGATYTAAFVSPDVGTGIEVDVSNIALTGVAAGNYHLTNTTTTTSADITASSATIALDAGQNLTPTYNSLAKPLIFSTTPSGLAHSVTYNGSATAPSDAGTYHVVATITDPNYSGSDTETLVIGKANATIHVTSYDVTFDGNAHTAAGTATGIGEDGALSGLDLSGTTHTTIGTYSEDPWTFTDVTGNYHNQSGTVDDAISATPVVTYTLTYTAGSGGTIVGTSPQTAASGTDGTTVTATPNTNFHFVSWSDASTTASRIDTNVTGDINATATFAADEVTPPTPTPTPPSGGGGGGGIVNGPLSYGYVNGGVVLGTSTEATTGGEVLGASTCSTALITEIPLSQGRKNNLGQVKALQGFLNSEMSANLPVNGVFGSMTTLAVKNFQLAHWQEVLAPWTHYGLATDHTATGIVYKTTGRMINNLNCAALNLPQPILP